MMDQIYDRQVEVRSEKLYRKAKEKETRDIQPRKVVIKTEIRKEGMKK